MSDELEAADVWDVFDHLVRTRNSAALHLPTEASTIDEPEKRCTQGEGPTNVRGSPVEAIPEDPDAVCGHCLADVNGTTTGGGSGGHDTRERIGEIIEEMGGTPP